MYPGHWAQVTPDKPAVVMAGTDDVVTFAELDERSTRLARLWHDAGLRPGDGVALFMENQARFLEVVWAAMRSGLRISPVNRYLTAPEAAYIVNDCDARAIVTSTALAAVAAELADQIPGCKLRLSVDGLVDGYDSYEDALVGVSADPLDDEPLGQLMLYSSGTTGRPKGVVRPQPARKVNEGLGAVSGLGAMFGMNADTVYLSPAPIYHAAPLGFCMGATGLGGTVVLMAHFDPLDALAALERHRCTHSQWVPTMFSRMLKLPEEDRTRFDLSAHKVAVHAAAPCPRPVKEAMFEWWGPIIHEYYGGSELNGLTVVGPQDWLAHPGTVGRAVLGTLHICDEEGNELPAGEPGMVYFEQEVAPFRYHKDEEQTRSSRHPAHANWTALGDVGFVDEDGFLFLTDRATFMIISGGVNIYPREIEDVLVMHPLVDDVAVIGVPNPDMGEEVKALVQLVQGVDGTPELADELIAFARERLTHYKCPKSVDFDPALPRLPTGKLYKRVLRDRYWGERSNRLT
ncbi:MAG: long-chain acyl-CoA synthetase [Actinomycetota bacterium]|nr:long-chain acyl-CoA synthetase [Actinomycetota bacterium]